MLELKSFLASRQYAFEEKFFLAEGGWSALEICNARSSQGEDGLVGRVQVHVKCNLSHGYHPPGMCVGGWVERCLPKAFNLLSQHLIQRIFTVFTASNSITAVIVSHRLAILEQVFHCVRCRHFAESLKRGCLFFPSSCCNRHTYCDRWEVITAW